MDKSQIEMLVAAAKAFDIILAGVRMELGGASDEEALEAVLHVRSVMHATCSHDEPREEVACIMERAIGRVKPLLKERVRRDAFLNGSDVIPPKVRFEMGDEEALEAVLDVREVTHALAEENPLVSSHETTLELTKRGAGAKSPKKIESSWADPIMEYIRSRRRVTTEEVLVNAIGKKRVDIKPQDISKVVTVLRRMGWVRRKIRAANGPTAQIRVFERPDGAVLNSPDLPKVIRSSVPNATCVLVKFSGGGVRAHVRGADLADRVNWISVESLQKHYRMPDGSRITAKTLERWQKILPS